MTDPLKKINMYDLVIIVLLIQFLANILYLSPFNNIIHLLTAVLSAVVLDFVIDFARFRSRQLPKSGLVSGLIIGLLIEPGSLAFGLPTAVFVSVIAILSKHILRFRGRHPFNPANLALLIATALGLGGAISWWGSAGVILPSLYLILPLGLLVDYKLKRLSISLPFLLLFALLNMSIAASNSPTILFFALIMVVEPVTSAQAGYRGKILYAIIAAVSMAVLSPAYALHGALFIANLLGFAGVWYMKTRKIIQPPEELPPKPKK